MDLKNGCIPKFKPFRGFKHDFKKYIKLFKFFIARVLNLFQIKSNG